MEDNKKEEIVEFDNEFKPIVIRTPDFDPVEVEWVDDAIMPEVETLPDPAKPELSEEAYATEGKTYGNTTASGASENVKDIVFWGDGDTFKLISKASSKVEQWMKSTKAMEIPGVGCVVQVTTQQYGNVAEAVTFVPGCQIITTYNETGEEILSRKLEKSRKS